MGNPAHGRSGVECVRSHPTFSGAILSRAEEHAFTRAIPRNRSPKQNPQRALCRAAPQGAAAFYRCYSPGSFLPPTSTPTPIPTQKPAATSRTISAPCNALSRGVLRTFRNTKIPNRIKNTNRDILPFFICPPEKLSTAYASCKGVLLILSRKHFSFR
jgi:hypothetical protein